MNESKKEEIVFPDSDLTRLKEHPPILGENMLVPNQMYWALLTRMEMAEDALVDTIDRITDNPNYNYSDFPKYEIWRKAAGK